MGGRGRENPQGNRTLRWVFFPFPVAESNKKGSRGHLAHPLAPGEISWNLTILDRRRYNVIFKASFRNPTATALSSLSPCAGRTPRLIPSPAFPPGHGMKASAAGQGSQQPVLSQGERPRDVHLPRPGPGN